MCLTRIVDRFCSAGNDLPNFVSPWDKAVAFYTGSRIADNPTYYGNLLHALADERCPTMTTCSDTRDMGASRPTSKVNIEIFNYFKAGQEMLLNNECEATRPIKERIVQLMSVPLIQSTLRFAHILENESQTSSGHVAEGAVFAASVLPIVHHCNEDDAAIIYDNMQISATPSVIFSEVKAAFEKNYECMGITCADIGGIYSEDDKAYKLGTGPCLDKSTRGKNSEAGKIAGLSILGIAIAGFIVVMATWSVKPRARPELEPALDLRMAENDEGGASFS
jgi:hypothetical protein